MMPTIASPASTESLPTKVVTFSSPAPTANKNTSGALKATASFKINKDYASRYLNTWGNGDGSGKRQCVELIKRYAAMLGFVNFVGRVNNDDLFTGTATLGDGNVTAQNFATASKGGFKFVSNGAASLPKAGAVISLGPWTTASGKKLPGHVGIIINYSNPSVSATTVSLKIFEQNMPVNFWEEVVFKKVSGKWYGTMPNSGGVPTVVGWANPAG